MKNLIPILVLVCGIYSCISRPVDECPTKFKIPTFCTPYQETYSIGDTLHFYTKFHKEVYEVTTDKRYNMERIDWDIVMVAYQLDSDSFSLDHDIRDYFQIMSDSIYSWDIFEFSSGKAILEADDILQMDTFSFEVRLVLKEKGLFYLGLGPFLVQSQQDFPGKCSRIGFESINNLNDGADNNIHLLEESPHEHWNTWLVERADELFYRDGVFCFRVME